jgi:hypothetical protein
MEVSESDIKVVKNRMLILMLLWLLLDIAMYVYTQDVTTIVRLFITSALFYMVYKGKNWARLIYLSCAALGITVGIGSTIYFSLNSLLVGGLMLIFTLYMAILPSYLAFNKKAKLYFKPEPQLSTL